MSHHNVFSCSVNFWLSQSLVETVWLPNKFSMGWESFSKCGKCIANLMIRMTVIGTIICSNFLHIEDGTDAQIWCGIISKKGWTTFYGDKLCYIRRIYEGLFYLRAWIWSSMMKDWSEQSAAINKQPQNNIIWNEMIGKKQG